MSALPLPDSVWSVLCCPQCGTGLAPDSDPLRCHGCDTVFPRSGSGSLDLRLQHSKRVGVDFDVGAPPMARGFRFDPLEFNPHPQVDFAGIDRLWHLDDELRSYFPRASRSGALALDMGCGTGLHRKVCERAGFDWIGLDYGEPDAPILGDAHALPFADSSVEFVVSMAVLEHIRYPFVAAKEVLRVLKPGGTYLGSVSFLEPFHGDSFYHHTHLGVFNTLATAGFEVVRAAPQPKWTGLKGMTHMALFPRVPSVVQGMLVWPLEVLSKGVWAVGRRVNASKTREERMRTLAGAFNFVARRPM